MIECHLENRQVREPERLLPVDGEYDVIIVGGGVAGSAAGIAAARQGCKTLIIERESAMGGLATVGLVNIPLDFPCGIGKEWLTELESMQGHWHRNSDPEKHKLVLDRMAIRAGCDLLYHTMVVDAIVRDNTICGVVVESKSGRQALLARRVVDASGDGGAMPMVGKAIPDPAGQLCFPPAMVESTIAGNSGHAQKQDGSRQGDHLSNDSASDACGTCVLHEVIISQFDGLAFHGGHQESLMRRYEPDMQIVDLFHPAGAENILVILHKGAIAPTSPRFRRASEARRVKKERPKRELPEAFSWFTIGCLKNRIGSKEVGNSSGIIAAK